MGGGRDERSPKEDLELRQAREADIPTLAALYADSVRALGREHYEADAVEAWASFAHHEDFHDFILKSHTLVAEMDDEIAGFAGMDTSGRIASVYVRPEHARKGVGSALLTALLDRGRKEGRRRFHTEASELSRPLFEKLGFSVVETEVVEREGVKIERYRMERIGRKPERP